MRISVNKNDEGFKPDAYAYLPFLDGEFVKDCYTADEEKGYVLVYRRNENNKLQANPITGKLKTKKLKGLVTVVKAPEGDINGTKI